MPKQNILITGSQGFIGKNLIRELNKQNAVNIFELLERMAESIRKELDKKPP